MDVFEKLHDCYPALALASYHLDDGERKKLVNELQNRWDDGERFVPRGGDVIEMFLGVAKRDADSEEELTACVNELASRIKDALVAQWAKQYSRDQVLTTLNLLGDLDYNGSLKMWGLPVRYIEIANAWNKAHPDERPLQQVGLES